MSYAARIAGVQIEHRFALSCPLSPALRWTHRSSAFRCSSVVSLPASRRGRPAHMAVPAAGQESRDSFSDALTDGRGQRKENLAAFALLGIDKHKGVSFGRPSRPSERRNIYFLRRLRIFRRSRSCGHSRTCPARRHELSQNPCALIIGHVIGQIVRFCILSSCPRPGL